MSGFQYLQMRSFRHGFKRAQREGPGAAVSQQDRRLIYQHFVDQAGFEQGPAESRTGFDLQLVDLPLGKLLQ